LWVDRGFSAPASSPYKKTPAGAVSFVMARVTGLRSRRVPAARHERRFFSQSSIRRLNASGNSTFGK
jgi:hypothetical protein